MKLGLPDHPDYSWFAVFDGHGGDLTSAIASQRVLSKVMATAEWKKDSVSPESIGRAIIRGFLEIDEEMRRVRSVDCWVLAPLQPLRARCARENHRARSGPPPTDFSRPRAYLPLPVPRSIPP